MLSRFEEIFLQYVYNNNNCDFKRVLGIQIIIVIMGVLENNIVMQIHKYGTPVNAVHEIWSHNKPIFNPFS